MLQQVGTNDPPLRCPTCRHEHKPGEHVYLFGSTQVSRTEWPGGAVDIEIGTRRAKAYCGAACVQTALEESEKMRRVVDEALEQSQKSEG